MLEKLHNYHEGNGWVSFATYLAGAGAVGLAEAWMVQQPWFIHAQVDAQSLEIAKAVGIVFCIPTSIGTSIGIAASHESSYNPTSTYLSTLGRRTGYFASGAIMAVGISAATIGLVHSLVLPNIQF